VDIGAGRLVKGADIDHAVGFVVHCKVGDRVLAGQVLATVHARTEQSAQEIMPALSGAFVIGDRAVEVPPAVLETVA